ncbi:MULTISPECIES: acyl carrier protein [Mycolicibacterium]|jgi:acyl carrier protein|uniref:Acyl carrier protein n=1 Tax=Mycolicibacterium neoaurum TaxID=1795 RepID=A0AAV2WES7_MYCNE|nr:acyl carrier protein [Mycolicibacterium neoaurum]QVI26721.1 acyl carrier protein [Mycolicibacterium neoaurum]TLH61989.1 acyl carrier protein [Mycolicibacterium neoaurum]CDQ42779.1 acyl carrier protein [Mycolicibacterium neoaurum]SDE79224.1 acyl carrier protein [Mycolicibacterium neoaurum]
MEISQSDAVDPQLLAILREDLNIDVSRLSRDSRLVDDAGMDSVAFAVGMVAIEDRLGAVLDEEDLLNCETLGDLEQVVMAKIPSAQANP